MERVKKQPKDHLQFNRVLFEGKRELIQNKHQHLCRHTVSPLPLRKVKNHHAIAISEHSEMLLQQRRARSNIIVNIYSRMHSYIILNHLAILLFSNYPVLYLYCPHSTRQRCLAADKTKHKALSRI